MASPDETPLFCDRCAAPLTPGRGEFYVVRIEAVADPSPPFFSAEDLARDVRRDIERLIARLGDLTEQEAKDQVYRRLVLYLCVPCYRRWIEDPTRS
jgi:hypothetical protein